MISFLRIKNIALIENIEINFHSGLNVLSGETGSGKTVIISSINFILGAKADKSLIRFGENSCEAEAVFNFDKNEGLSDLLQEYDIEYDGELIINRKLNVDGKGSIRVNGVSCTSQMLKEIASEICDIYGQSEHYSLLKEGNQLKVLDGFIGNDAYKLKEELRPIIKEIKECKKNLEELGGSDRERAIKIDLIKYELNEIESASLVEGEEEKLLERRKIAQNFEKIYEVSNFAHEGLSSDDGVLDIISRIIKKTGDISNLDEKYAILQDRLENIKSDILDISDEFEGIADGLDISEYDLNEIESRLDTIKTLKNKYGQTIEDIFKFYDKESKELDKIQNFDKLSKDTLDLLEKDKIKLSEVYGKLTKIRREKAIEFSSRIEKELANLGMKNAKFLVNIGEEGDVLSIDGNNSIEFLFSANQGEPLKTMGKIISGGEMSRFMLAMKIVSSVLPKGSTYIFDEIDAGISGITANVIGEKFALIGTDMQVITISHLPQIVAFSDKSYKICKEDIENRTRTKLIELDEEGKVKEIARIVGGLEENESFKNNAMELIKEANNKKNEIRK